MNSTAITILQIVNPIAGPRGLGETTHHIESEESVWASDRAANWLVPLELLEKETYGPIDIPHHSGGIQLNQGTCCRSRLLTQ